MLGLGVGVWRKDKGAKRSAPDIESVVLTPLPARIGQEISCQVAWSGSPQTGVTYQWRLDATDVGGATAATYTPAAADLGGALTCRVVIDNGVGTDSGASAAATVEGPSGNGSVLLVVAGGDRLLVEAGGGAILIAEVA